MMLVDEMLLHFVKLFDSVHFQIRQSCMQIALVASRFGGFNHRSVMSALFANIT